MEVTKDDIEQFGKKVNARPLWNAIRTDGNCFFQALEYATYHRLSKTPRTIQFRQTIVSTMNKPIVSGVPYEIFMYGTKSDTKWPYAELDVVIAAAKYIKRTILVISLGKNGGVTMIRPCKITGNPVFLICDKAIHYIPFQKGIKLTQKMRQLLKDFEKTKVVEHTDGAIITSFLLKDMMSVMKPIKSLKSVKVKTMKHVNSLVLTRKRLS